MWVYIFSQNLYSALVWNIHSLHSCWILDILLFFSEVLIILGVSEVVCLGSSQDWATPEHSQGCPSTTLCCSGHVTTGLSPVWGPECSGWGFHQVPLMETFSLALMRPEKLLLLFLFSLLWSDWTHWLFSCTFHHLFSTWNNYKMNWHILLNAKIHSWIQFIRILHDPVNSLSTDWPDPSKWFVVREMNISFLKAC